MPITNNSILYTFGDSFAWSAGLWPGEPYYEQYPEYRAKRYEQILEDHFHIKSYNYGIPRASSELVLLRLCNQLENITKDDIVLITPGQPFRFNHLVQEGASHRLHPASVDTLEEYTIGRQESEHYINYFYHIKNNQTERQFDEWKYVMVFTSILKTIGCTGLVWQGPNMGFDTISEDDEHYSWRGNEELANWMIDNIKIGEVVDYDNGFQVHPESLTHTADRRDVRSL